MSTSSEITQLVQAATQPLMELEGHRETVAAYVQRGMTRQQAMRQEQLYESYVTIDKAQILVKGKILTEARETAEHGTWNEVVLPRYGITERTAQNLMNAWRRFGEDPSSIARLKPSAVYLLSAPDAPEQFVEEILEESRNGHDFTVNQIRERRKGLMVQPPRSATDPLSEIDNEHFEQSATDGIAAIPVRMQRARAVNLVLSELIGIINEEVSLYDTGNEVIDEHAQRNARSLAVRAYGMIVTDPSLAIIQRHLLITLNQQEQAQTED
jgi:hypothetical protein